MTHIPTWTKYHQNNILTNFHIAQSKNAASGVWTIFSFIDLVSDPHMIHIRTWTRYHLDKHSDQISRCLSKKCGIQSVNKIFLQFGLVIIFELGLDIIQLNILTKLQAAVAKHAASTELTRFSLNLA